MHKNNLLTLRLDISLALAAAAIASQAAGQTPGAPGVNNRASADTALEEVVVSARRRDESIQDVPITVTAFGAERFQREQMAGLRDLNMSAPNLSIVNNTGTSNSAQVFIRGVGRDDSTWNVESGVAIYIDGVYLPQANGALLDLVDFERVEVLNGPQGTLYGRNATGGAIKFVTRKPDPDEFRGIAEVEIGSFNKLDMRGTANIPLAENWALKLDYVSRDEEGFVRVLDSSRRVNGTNRQTGRATLRHAGDWDVSFSVDYQLDRSGLQSPTPIRFDAPPGGGFGAPTPLDGDGLQVPAYGQFVANPGVPDLNRFSGTGYALSVTRETPLGQLSSTTAYRSFDWDVAIDLDGNANIPFDLTQKIEDAAFSQELQISSSNELGLNYVLGLYYFQDDLTAGADNIFIGRRNDSEQEITSMAAYGELTWDLNERVQLFAGGRYTRDKKDIEQTGSALGSGAGAFDVEVSESWNNFTPRVGVNVSFTDDVMVYATYSEGFKAGGVIDGRPATATAASTFYDPEEVEAVEIGVKSSWFQRRLVANLAAFDLDYSNIAFTFLDPATNSLSVAPAGFNIQGLEYSVEWRPLNGLMLYAIGGVIEGDITDIPVNTATGAFLGGFNEDSELKHTPRNHYKLGIDYRQLLPRDIEMHAGVNVTYNDLIYRNTANSFQGATPETTLVDARIGLNFGDGGRYSLVAGVQNLTDEDYWLQSLSTFSRWYARPRTWSLTLRTEF